MAFFFPRCKSPALFSTHPLGGWGENDLLCVRRRRQQHGWRGARRVSFSLGLESRFQTTVSKRLAVFLISREELEEAMVDLSDQCLLHVPRGDFWNLSTLAGRWLRLRFKKDADLASSPAGCDAGFSVCLDTGVHSLTHPPTSLLSPLHTHIQGDLGLYLNPLCPLHPGL